MAVLTAAVIFNDMIFDHVMPLKSQHTPQTQRRRKHFPIWATSQLLVFSSVHLTNLLIKSWGWSHTQPLLCVPRVPWYVACGGHGGAIQAKRAAVRCRESVQDVRPWAGVGVSFLCHQHLEQCADLRQEGPAQWAILLWSFTWEEKVVVVGGVINRSSTYCYYYYKTVIN